MARTFGGGGWQKNAPTKLGGTHGKDPETPRNVFKSIICEADFYYSLSNLSICSSCSHLDGFSP